MKVYTIREAARETKIGMMPLKRACEEGVIRATKLTNNQWRIAESALTEALDKGIDFSSLPKKAAKKKPQPEHLRKGQEAKKQAAATKAPKAPKPTKASKAK